MSAIRDIRDAVQDIHSNPCALMVSISLFSFIDSLEPRSTMQRLAIVTNRAVVIHQRESLGTRCVSTRVVFRSLREGEWRFALHSRT